MLLKKIIFLILFLLGVAESGYLTVLPKALKEGDTIGLITPAKYADETTLNMIDYLEAMGFKVVLAESFSKKWYLFGGKDEERAADINKMFEDKNINAIFCVRGGYGSLRLLDLIDFEIIKKNPKIFIGYSDITTLLLAINQKAELVTYHAPMSYNFKSIDVITINSLITTLMKNNSTYELSDYLWADFKTLSEGIAEGEIVGGNLSLIVASLGTEYEINTKGKILFIEEVGEHTYKVDRMLQQLKLAGKFRDAVGIILGDFTDIEQNHADAMSLDDVFHYLFTALQKPVISNFKSGHAVPFVTVPIGAKAKLNTFENKITILDGSIS